MPTEEEQKWIAAWRLAGPELERIRREELRNMSEDVGLQSLGALDSDSDHAPHGLVTFQAWMSRWRILQMMGRERLQ